MQMTQNPLFCSITPSLSFFEVSKSSKKGRKCASPYPLWAAREADAVGWRKMEEVPFASSSACLLRYPMRAFLKTARGTRLPFIFFVSLIFGRGRNFAWFFERDCPGIPLRKRIIRSP